MMCVSGGFCKASHIWQMKVNGFAMALKLVKDFAKLQSTLFKHQSCTYTYLLYSTEGADACSFS